MDHSWRFFRKVLRKRYDSEPVSMTGVGALRHLGQWNVSQRIKTATDLYFFTAGYCSSSATFNISALTRSSRREQ